MVVVVRGSSGEKLHPRSGSGAPAELMMVDLAVRHLAPASAAALKSIGKREERDGGGWWRFKETVRCSYRRQCGLE